MVKMGSSVDNSTKIQTEITNDFLIQLESICTSSCDANVSGNTIIIAGETGDVTLEAICEADSSCTMTNQATSVAQSSIETIAKQDASAVTDYFGGFSYQDMDNGISVVNTLTNHITQISTTTCNSDSSSTVSNNFIYVKEGGKTGDLKLSATGNANASCVMSNMAKIEAYNEVQSNTDQSAKTIGQFSMYGIAAMMVVVVIGIVVVIVVLVGSLAIILKGSGSKSKYPPGTEGKDAARMAEVALSKMEGAAATTSAIASAARSGGGSTAGSTKGSSTKSSALSMLNNPQLLAALS